MAKIGSETRPVYVGANGEARPCDVDLHDISVENKGDNEVIAIITIDGTPYNIKNFKQGGNAFVVTFKDWNGTVLKTEAVLKGGNATPPTNPTREGYDFDKWDGKYTNVQQDETVTASYTQKMLTVTFKLNGGNISGSTADVVINNVAYGTKFSEVKKLVTNPTRTSTAQYNYTFNGWDKDDTLEIKTNTTATAQWNSVERYYTVTFKNYNATSAAAGTTLETKFVKYGATPAYTGTTPSVESPVTGKTYTWNSSDGWTPALSAVTGDAVYVAKYTEGAATVTVTFNLDGGNIGGSTDPVVRTVNYGTALSDVTKPDNPSKTGYNFTSWGDPDPASAISSDSKVIGNCLITALYEEIGYISRDYFTMRYESGVKRRIRNGAGPVGGDGSAFSPENGYSDPISLKSGRRYRITIDDGHMCYATTSDNTISDDGYAVEFITTNAVINITEIASGSIIYSSTANYDVSHALKSHSTHRGTDNYSSWPQTVVWDGSNFYCSEGNAYIRNGGGEEDHPLVGGAKMVFETQLLTQDDTLKMILLPTHEGVYVDYVYANARWTVEEIA